MRVKPLQINLTNKLRDWGIKTQFTMDTSLLEIKSYKIPLQQEFYIENKKLILWPGRKRT